MRFKMSGQVFAMKTIEKTVAKRAGQVSQKKMNIEVNCS